jgi:hypothetical protein
LPNAASLLGQVLHECLGAAEALRQQPTRAQQSGQCIAHHVLVVDQVDHGQAERRVQVHAPAVSSCVASMGRTRDPHPAAASIDAGHGAADTQFRA